MNFGKIEKLWKQILEEIGEDTSRPGLKETPKRISKMYSEIFKGYDEKNKPSITQFENGKDGLSSNGIICDKGYFFSHCEHHGVPFFGEYYFGYIPGKNLIGLSKIARLIDFYSSKLQVQERLTRQVMDEIQNEVNPKGAILILKARHFCKELRGVKKFNGNMITSECSGKFEENSNLKEEFMNLVSFDTKWNLKN
jgi:GTP cyclohydrolase IA